MGHKQGRKRQLVPTGLLTLYKSQAPAAGMRSDKAISRQSLLPLVVLSTPRISRANFSGSS